MKATGLHSVNIAVNRDYKVTATELLAEVQRRKDHGEKPLKGLIMSSPSNPTGAMLTPAELRGLCDACTEHGILFLSDEIYHGISYGSDGEASAVQYTDNAVVINSFSKFYSMTGWRLVRVLCPVALTRFASIRRPLTLLVLSSTRVCLLVGQGWLVVPPSLVDVMNRLSQNMYINAPTLSQYAACHAFSPEVLAELNDHVAKVRDLSIHTI